MQRHFLHCPSAITALLVIAASGMAGCLAQPRMAPYPFAESPARFELVRRVMPKAARAEVLATPPEQVAITIER